MGELHPDLVLVEQSLHNPETYRLLLQRAGGHFGVAMWGHGRSYSSSQSALAAAVKQWLTRQCDWFFAYTAEGADQVVEHGFPRARTTVVNNSIDTDRLRDDLEAVSLAHLDEFRQAHQLTTGSTALFLGGVDERKGIGFLLDSARAAAELMPGFVLLIAGDGDSAPSVRAAQAAGLPVRFLGRADGAAKALALRATDVLAIPRQVGLVALDALVAGRPLVTTSSAFHGPEFGYLVPGGTSVVADQHPKAYAEALVSTLTSTDRLAVMQAEARRASQRYSLGYMVDSFVDGVIAWQELRSAGLTTRRLPSRPTRSGGLEGTESAAPVPEAGSCRNTEIVKIAVLMTCHNRRDQTLRCLDALRAQAVPRALLRVYITDDGSTDGSTAAILAMEPTATVIPGSGDLYWAAGMALAERVALQEDPDLLLWLNDDVFLDPGALTSLLEVHRKAPEAIVVGAVRDPDTGTVTYGGRMRKGRHPQRFVLVQPSPDVRRVDAFNGNVVLVPRSAREAVGPIDGSFRHAYADDDYSLRAAAAGITSLAAPSTVGVCRTNTRPLGRGGARATWRQLQSPTGRPWRSQVRYLRRHGERAWPVYLVWGYVKALAKSLDITSLPGVHHSSVERRHRRF